MTSAVRAYLPATVAALLVWLLATGQIYLLIHANPIWLVALAVPVLAAMTIAQVRHGSVPHHDRVALVLLAIPVVLGIVVPARPLGSFAVDQQATSNQTNAVWQSNASFSFERSDSIWDLPQLARVAASDPSLRDFAGQRTSLLGFVYRRSTTPSDQFLVSRFVVRCCTADAVAMSFPVHFAGSANFARDTWVQVDGQIHLTGPADAPVPVIEADTVKTVPQPSQPYLYP